MLWGLENTESVCLELQDSNQEDLQNCTGQDHGQPAHGDITCTEVLDQMISGDSLKTQV